MYTVPADDMYLFLERDVQKERTQSEAEKVNEQEERALTEISAFTGISVMRLYSLPPDVKSDVIAAYMTGVNLSNEENVKTKIQNILDGKPNEPTMEQTAEKDSYLKTTEELIEANYNSIDGVINNLPSGTSVIGGEEKRPSLLKAIRDIQGEMAKEKENSPPPVNQSLDLGGEQETDERQRK